MLAGFGAASVLRRYPRHARMVLALLALPIAAEGWFAGGAMPVPRPMREGAVPQGAVVLGLPMDLGAWNAVPQYRAVVGGYRAVNGYSGYEPAQFVCIAEGHRGLRARRAGRLPPRRGSVRDHAPGPRAAGCALDRGTPRRRASVRCRRCTRLPPAAAWSGPWPCRRYSRGPVAAGSRTADAVRRGVIRQIQLSAEPASRLPLSARIDGLCTRF